MSQKVIDYKIVEAPGKSKFEKLVKESLEAGYELLGAALKTPMESSTTYTQTMVKYEASLSPDRSSEV